jgi:hypothetical protein
MDAPFGRVKERPNKPKRRRIHSGITCSLLNDTSEGLAPQIKQQSPRPISRTNRSRLKIDHLTGVVDD